MSIGPWQIILFLILFILGSYGALAIYLDRTERVSSRVEYIIWAISVLVFAALSDYMVELLPSDIALMMYGAAFIIYLILFWHLAKRISWRTRDAGLPRWFAYFAVVPTFINVVAIIVLMFWPPDRATSSTQNL